MLCEQTIHVGVSEAITCCLKVGVPRTGITHLIQFTSYICNVNISMLPNVRANKIYTYLTC